MKYRPYLYSLAFLFALAIAGRINPWNAIAVIWNILCSLSGTHVRVVTDDAKVLVRIL